MIPLLSSVVQDSVCVLDAPHDFLLLEGLYGSMDERVDVGPLIPDQALGAHRLELLFDLAEHQLYRI